MEFTLTVKYKYADELQISVSDLISEWMFGIPLKDNKGYYYSLTAIKNKILFAQSFISNLLNEKFVPTRIDDKVDYVSEEFMNMGYVKFTYPINRILTDSDGHALVGRFNDYKVVGFPLNWVTFNVGRRSIGLVPGMTGTGSMVMSASGTVYTMLNKGIRYTPNFWRLSYITGYTILPYDIKTAVAKLSVLSIFAVIGDVLRPVGISSQSLSLDGLSQSISTTLNSQGNLLSPRINQYYKELFGNSPDGMSGELNYLINKYRGIMLETL